MQRNNYYLDLTEARYTTSETSLKNSMIDSYLERGKGITN